MKKKKDTKAIDERNLKLTENAIKFGEDIKNILPKKIPKQGETRDTWDDDMSGKQLSKVMQKKISKLTDQLEEMDNQKERLILKIIGKLYEGVLIPQELTMRKGYFFEYRRQQKCSLEQVKEKIEKNKAIVSQKLAKPIMEIMEFMLEKYKVNSNDDEDRRRKIINTEEFCMLKNDDEDNVDDDDNCLRLNIIKINAINISSSGRVEFCFQSKEDGLYEHSLYNKVYDGLFVKFKDKIKQNAELFLQELEADVNSFEKDMQEIKEKGQNQLALIELEKNGTDFEEDEDDE